MTNKNMTDSLKNAMGTVFLLAGAFFVCSTLLSIRAVFADPIAPVNDIMSAGSRANNRTSPRGNTSARNNPSRATIARTTTSAASRPTAAPARGVASRPTMGRAIESNVRTNATASRNVVSRQTNAAPNIARSVRPRMATAGTAANARVSLQGSAIRGNKAAVNTNSSTYSYLSNALYTGNYSNIIDSTTGLISNDAFNNCMESYYTCMDEICTARNAAQRRCACAGRVRAFADAELALETANEELIKVSGELALLVATKGKDISSAFQLTDAEKVMNCVSWRDVTNQYGENSEQAIKWCNDHAIYGEGGETLTKCEQPLYCAAGGNSFGFDIKNIDGTGSDILASLQAWADAKEQTITILDKKDDDLIGAFEHLSGVISGMQDLNGALLDASENGIEDRLAETWGYDLFAYAHNNVCARVLDSCFNGIYEACGTPPSNVKCSNGAKQCPYNYNSNITVNNTTDGTNLNFIESSGDPSNSATCFGYTSVSGDPYSNLRGPVADARRSIMQKYALDANADCDLYGEQLRATAQNIGYQKVAAQQALQQKRLEFKLEEEESVLTAAQTAMSNFNLCLSEIYECYVETAESEDNWTTSRIKSYCAQMVNVPHCYEEMICSPSGAQFAAVIDDQDNAQCTNSQDYTKNTCRNVVTLNEILNGAYTDSLQDFKVEYGDDAKQDSTQLREYCLRNAMGIPLDGQYNETQDDTWTIRNWKKDSK